MKLIENWRLFWRFWSIRLTALGTLLVGYIAAVPDALITMWGMLPDDLKAVIPPNYLMFISVAILAAGMISRVIKQEKISNECKQE